MLRQKIAMQDIIIILPCVCRQIAQEPSVKHTVAGSKRDHSRLRSIICMAAVVAGRLIQCLSYSGDSYPISHNNMTYPQTVLCYVRIGATAAHSNGYVRMDVIVKSAYHWHFLLYVHNIETL